MYAAKKLLVTVFGTAPCSVSRA